MNKDSLLLLFIYLRYKSGLKIYVFFIQKLVLVNLLFYFLVLKSLYLLYLHAKFVNS